MVSIRKAKQGFAIRRRQNEYDKEKIGLLAGGLCIGVLLVVMYNSVTGETRELPPALREGLRPHPMLQDVVGKKPLPDSYNAIALDILQVLQCDQVFNLSSSSSSSSSFYGGKGNDLEVDTSFSRRNRRRRLEEGNAQQHGDDGGFGDRKKDDLDGGYGEKKGGAGGGGVDDALRFNNKDRMRDGMLDDFLMNEAGGAGGYWREITAKHLFCVAASTKPPPTEITSNLHCDAAGERRKYLLDLWSSARAQISQDLLVKILELGKEQSPQQLMGKTYYFWSPDLDKGLSYMINSLNEENNADHGGVHGLHDNLGPGKLFVDVGSCLGVTTLAVANLYPGTKIVSIEPASPNWLYQEINLKCNLDHDAWKSIHVMLAGVGPNTEDEDYLMAKVMWRPSATTSTRAWTPKSEFTAEEDVELVLRLRRLKSILGEADVYGMPIDVLNVDCEGCEYNLIPALTEEEFDAIPTVMGGVHWGYIPINKLPSSERGKKTHQRLCQHENIARTSKECCAFPDLQVKSSVPGEVLVQDTKGFPSKASTVADVAGALCDGFDQWATEHYLNDVRNDWNWFELTSQA